MAMRNGELVKRIDVVFWVMLFVVLCISVRLESETTATISLHSREQWERLAQETAQAPVDARLDRVWQAIPGYNGIALDLEKSMRANKPIYVEKAPKISLRDLGAHPIYRGNPHKPAVAFMVNVAWGNEYLSTMLDIFREHGIHSTFFLDGSWLKKNREWAARILNEGHELANHGYSHRNMSRLSEAEIEQELLRTEEQLQAVGVFQNRLFAPPSGDFDRRTVEIAARHQLFTVLWTVDTVDWRNPPATQIVNKITRALAPGTLVLMHPTKSSVAALPDMIRAAMQKKLKPMTVSQLLSPKFVGKIN
jgi:probable sporulation protein (polysaccharide deacetylase family)